MTCSVVWTVVLCFLQSSTSLAVIYGDMVCDWKHRFPFSVTRLPAQMPRGIESNLENLKEKYFLREMGKRWSFSSGGSISIFGGLTMGERRGFGEELRAARKALWKMSPDVPSQTALWYMTDAVKV